MTAPATGTSAGVQVSLPLDLLVYLDQLAAQIAAQTGKSRSALVAAALTAYAQTPAGLVVQPGEDY